MCGFVGVVNLRPNNERLQRIAEAIGVLTHRGPDDRGMLISSGFALGHARLSIIDTSEAAKQPMSDSSGRYIIIFNGEIYNYKEISGAYLKEEYLINKRSDTAVLLALYIKYGEKCLDYINGMFSFVILDRVTQEIFMARDRFGEKPLYWINTPEYIAFSSEIRALKKLIPDRDWSINYTAIHFYHSIGSIPSPYTIYNEVNSLRAGHWIRYFRNGESRTKKYWELGEKKNNEIKNRGEAVERCGALLKSAIKSRLVSDVPIGVFLSGGLDSGAIMSVIAEMGGGVPDSLCIDFSESMYSEFNLAKKTAERFGSTLHRSTISAEMFESGLHEFFDASDQPTSDGFNTYFVSHFAKRLGIKVWLSGVGGDELFGGYPSFFRAKKIAFISKIAQNFLPTGLSREIETRYPTRFRLARIANLGRRGDPSLSAYQYLRNSIPTRMVSDFMRPEFSVKPSEAINVLNSIYPRLNFFSDEFRSASLAESSIYMSSQLLRDIDNFSMAHSIEVRAPFLDHELFENILSLESRLKKDGERAKPLLVDALKLKLPDEVLRGTKKGFSFPIEVWLKSKLRETFEEVVLSKENMKFWNMPAIEKIWDGYLDGRVHWSIVWQFYSIARWFEKNNA